MSTIRDQIINSSEYSQVKQGFLEVVQKELSKINKILPPQKEKAVSYETIVQKVGKERGRDLFFKFVGSGAGNGPFVELIDGSVKYDLITGIGVNFFGHSHFTLMNEMIDGVWGDVMQGNLSPNQEYADLISKLLKIAGEKSNFNHVWLTTCGAIANETALKIIRQKKYPATKFFAFKDCFAGRTTALQELTDNPAYRQGQPVYGEVFYLPFYNPKDKNTASSQAEAVIAIMKEEFHRYPSKYAGLEFEIVQGEGGFNVAPSEFIVPVVKAARALGLAIWDDEVQTFGRTGEVFCYKKVGLEGLIDVVTVAKLLQNGAVLYTSEYNPKPGLVSGTFAGSTSALKAGIKILDLLESKFVGPNGRIAELEKLTISEFERLKKSEAGKHLVDYTVYGGMVAMTLFDGKLESVKKFLNVLWDQGIIAFYCGHGPYRVRMLPPFGALTDLQWKEVFQIFERSILNTAKQL